MPSLQIYIKSSPVSRSLVCIIEPSLEQGWTQTELDDVPELLDFTEELLLESVEEFDFAEEELFFDEDWALLLLEEGLDGSPPLRSEDDSAMELLVSFSGSTKLLLSSSPQATNKKANASVKKRRMDPRPFDQG